MDYFYVRRQILLEKLKKLSFKQGEFTLSSGKKSDFYINCKKSLDAEGLVWIGELFRQRIGGTAIGCGGLTMGADPLATATSMFNKMYFNDKLEAFYVRKEAKGHGSKQYIEGPDLPASSKVAILEDVITTGDSAIKAIRRVREHGWNPIMVLAVVDRLEVGRRAIEEQTFVPVDSIFTRKDFIP